MKIAGTSFAALVLLSAASEASAAEAHPGAANLPDAPISMASAAASAEADTYSQSSREWEVTFIPYVWASGMTAEMETRQGEDIDVDQSFGDILGDLKFVFMGALDARRGRFVTLSDIVYLSISSKADGSLGPIPLEGEADVKTFVATPLVGYRVVDKGPLFLDLMGGARMTSVDVDLTVSGPLQSIEREASKQKVGPVIASRAHIPFSDEWGMTLYGDVGDLGLTSKFRGS